ncbi:hypothetical protein CWS02_14020 [Enterobacter sp. EA-1]|nr:hypothetical protein CWS02_14020 [Enterobacter sp. EA-1]
MCARNNKRWRICRRGYRSRNGSSGTGVAQLSALLPLLPLLPAIREELGERTLPTGNSWLEWSAAVADILAASEHPALQQLRQQLEQNIEAWISDTLLPGRDRWRAHGTLTSRRLPESWSMTGIAPEGMREEGGYLAQRRRDVHP